MKKTLALIGAGDLGKQIAHYAISDKIYNKVVFFDDFITKENELDGYVGKISCIPHKYQQKKFDEVIIAIGYKHMNKRQEILTMLLDNKIPLGTVIHSSCQVDSTANIKEGCVIFPSCIIDKHVEVSENCLINISCTIAHDSFIGQNCFLSPRVAIAGFTHIGSECILGINCTIIDNLTISKNIRIGAGSLVLRSIAEPGVYVGNPIKFLKKI